MSVPRVAIVTGAAQGIGLAIAVRLAHDGLDIAINDIPAKSAAIDKAVQAIKAIGRRAIAVPADVSSETDVKRMVDTTVSELGQLDVMVANAGMTMAKPFLEMTVEEHDRIMSVDSRGPMLCFRYAAMQMIKQGNGGRMIVASSLAGKRGIKLCSSYSMSKFSVRGLVQVLAQELREHNIFVNGYAPGAINTELVMQTVASLGLDVDHTDSIRQMLKAFGLEDCPLGQSEHVASLVSYLVKHESEFITGQTISVDGGVYFD